MKLVCPFQARILMGDISSITTSRNNSYGDRWLFTQLNNNQNRNKLDKLDKGFTTNFRGK